MRDLILWIENGRAVATGDTLIDFGRGVEINDWLRASVTPERSRPSAVSRRCRYLLGCG